MGLLMSHVMPATFAQMAIPACYSKYLENYTGFDHDSKSNVAQRGDSVTVNAWYDDLPKVI